jgi:AraC-like DNA-binding protein
MIAGNVPRLLQPSRESARYSIAADGVALLEAAFEHHVYERHMHETYAIGFTLRGVQRFWCRGVTNDSTPGDVIVIGPGEAHDGQSGAPGGYAYRMFYLPIERVKRVLSEATGQTETIDARVARFTDETARRKLGIAWRAARRSPSSLAAEELLDDMLLGLAARRGTSRSARVTADPIALQRVRDYLHMHVDQPVSGRELAEIAAMSRFQLTRQFQHAFGLPLHGYHLHVRLEEAKRRLSRGDAVASVAMDLGFADQSHLHRRFKGAFGVTPGQWRRCTTIQD